MAAYDLGRASGIITINVDAALASYAKVRAAHAETMTTMGQVQKTARTVGLGLVGIGAAALFGFGEAVKAAASFQKELSYYGAVTGSTKEQIEAVGKAALDIDKTTGIGIAAVTDAFVQLGKSGVSAEDIIGGVGQATVDLARAAGISATDSANIIVQTMHAFGLGAKSAEHVADVLAGAANASTIDITELAAGLKYAGQSAAVLHIPFEDLAATIAYLGNVGIRGTTAGTSLRMMLTSLGGRTGPAIEALKELNIITADGSNKFFTLQGRAKSMAQIAQVLQKSFQGLTDKEKVHYAQEIFGNRAMSAAIALARGGKVAIQAMSLEISKVTAYDVMRQRMDNLSGAVQRFKVALQIAAIESGNPFQKPLQNMVEFLTMVINAFNGLPQPVKTAIATLLLVVGVLATLAGGFILLIGFLAKLKASFASASELGAFLRNLGVADVELKAVGDQAEATAAKVVAANEAMNASSAGPARGANGRFVSKGAAAGEGEAVAGEAEAAGTAAEEGLVGATGAAEGLSMSLGPIGIALGAIATIGAAVWYISSRGAQKAKEAVDGYANALEDSTNNIDVQRAKLVDLSKAQQKAQLTFLQGIKKNGGNVDFGDLQKYAAANSEYTKQIDAQQDKLNSTRETVDTLSKAYGLNYNQVQALAQANNIDLSKGLGASGEAFASALEAAKESHQPMVQAKDDMVAFGSAAASADDDVKALTASFAELTGNALDADDAHIQFKNDTLALEKALKKSGNTIVGNGSKALAARSAFNQLAKDTGSWAEAEAKLPGGVRKATAALKDSIKVLKANSDGSAHAKAVIKDLEKTLHTITGTSKAAGDGLTKGAAAGATKMGKIVGKAIKDLGGHTNANAAKTSGAGVGKDFDSGTAGGITDNTPIIQKAAASAIRAAVQAAKDAQDSSSPSKVMHKVGGDWGIGYAGGILESIKLIVSAAKKAAHEAIVAAREVQKGIAAAVAPDETDPNVLKKQLKHSYLVAVSKQTSANQLDKVTKSATKSLDKLKSIDGKRSKELLKSAKAAGSVSAAIDHLNKRPINATTVDAAKEYAKALHAAAEQMPSGKAKTAFEKEAEAASHAADKISHKWDQVERQAERVQTKAKNASDKADQAAQNAASKAQAMAQALVGVVQGEIDDFTSQIADFQQTISQGLSQGTDIQSIWSALTDDGGAGGTVQNLQGQLDTVEDSVRQFGQDLQGLAKMGASQDLLTQIAGMGPTQGDVLAKQLLAAGSSSVGKLNDTLTTIDQYVDKTTSSLSKGYFGAGEDSMAQFIKGLEKKFPELKKALKQLLKILQGSLDFSQAVTATDTKTSKAVAAAKITSAVAAPAVATKAASTAKIASSQVATDNSKIVTVNMGDTYNPVPETSTTTAARRMRTLAAIGPWSD